MYDGLNGCLNISSIVFKLVIAASIASMGTGYIYSTTLP